MRTLNGWKRFLWEYFYQWEASMLSVYHFRRTLMTIRQSSQEQGGPRHNFLASLAKEARMISKGKWNPKGGKVQNSDQNLLQTEAPNPNTGMVTPRTAENPRTLSSLKGLAVIQFSSRNWWERVEVELIDALTLTNLAFPIKEITIRKLNWYPKVLDIRGINSTINKLKRSFSSLKLPGGKKK